MIDIRLVCVFLCIAVSGIYAGVIPWTDWPHRGWYILRDNKVGWNVSRAMPIAQNTDYTPTNTRPTVIVVTRFDIPDGLHCDGMAIDMPIYRRFPRNLTSLATDPGQMHFFLWNESMTGPWGEISGQMIDSWRHTVPDYNATWAPTRSLGVYRFQHQFGFSANAGLDGGHSYWLGVFLEQPQFGNSLNTAYWLAGVNETTQQPFQYIDVNANYIPNPNLAQPQVNLTTAPSNTVYYANLSITYLSVTLLANCTVTTNDTDITAPLFANPPLQSLVAPSWYPLSGLPPSVTTYAPTASPSSTSIVAQPSPSPLPVTSIQVTSTPPPPSPQASWQVGLSTITIINNSPSPVAPISTVNPPPPLSSMAPRSTFNVQGSASMASTPLPPSSSSATPVPSPPSSNSTPSPTTSIITDGIEYLTADTKFIVAVGIAAFVIVVLIIIVVVLIVARHKAKVRGIRDATVLSEPYSDHGEDVQLVTMVPGRLTNPTAGSSNPPTIGKHAPNDEANLSDGDDPIDDPVPLDVQTI